MFGRCFKNYFSSLRYVFGVLGILFLALLIGGSIFIQGTADSLNTMTSQIKETTGQADLSLDKIMVAAKSEFQSEITQLTDDGSGDSLVSGDEAKDVAVTSVSDAISETVDNYTEYISQIGTIIANALQTIFVLLAVAVLIQIIGVMVGRSYVLLCAGADIEHRNPLATIGSRLFYDLLILVAAAVIIGVYCMIPKAGIVLLILFPFVYCLVSLFSANIGLGRKKRVPMKQALAVKNIFVLLGCNLLQLIVTIILAAVIASISNVLIGIYVVLSLAVVASASVSLNAEAIVYKLAENKKNAELKENDADIAIVEIEDEPEKIGMNDDTSEDSDDRSFEDADIVADAEEVTEAADVIEEAEEVTAQAAETAEDTADDPKQGE